MKVVYEFDFENGEKNSYEVIVNEETMDLQREFSRAPSAWTALGNSQCSHCPLKVEDSPRCPVAVNLDDLVEHFKDSKSMWTGTVTVHTKERTFKKETDLQTALFGVFGLIMATSPCPYMNFLKPMARFHLPFSTLEETIVRSTSMYLLKQYFISKEGGTPDVDLKGLEKSYSDLNEVNLGIINRIRELGKGDTESNAIVILDSFAQMLSMEITNDLEGIKKFVI